MNLEQDEKILYFVIYFSGIFLETIIHMHVGIPETTITKCTCPMSFSFLLEHTTQSRF